MSLLYCDRESDVNQNKEAKHGQNTFNSYPIIYKIRDDIEIIKKNRELSQKEAEIMDLKKELEIQHSQIQQLKEHLKETESKNSELKTKLQQVLDKKIEDDPKTNTDYLKLQKEYEKLTDESLDEIVDVLLDGSEGTELDDIYEFLIQFLVINISENANFSLEKQIVVEELSSKLQQEAKQKFDISDEVIENSEKIYPLIESAVDFHLDCCERKKPITFVTNTKISFDTSKVELKNQHIRIKKILRPGIRVGGVLISKASVKVELK